jgi:hypothetical protein
MKIVFQSQSFGAAVRLKWDYTTNVNTVPASRLHNICPCPLQSVSLHGHALVPPRPRSVLLAQTVFVSQTVSHINTTTISLRLLFILTPPIKMEQIVPKRRNIKFRRQGITQKIEYNMFSYFRSLYKIKN